MVEDYLGFSGQQDRLLYTLQPNVTKAVLKTTVNVGIILLLLIGGVVFLHFSVGLGVFAAVFNTFGIQTSALLSWKDALFVLGCAALLVMASSFDESRTKYEVYQNKLIASKGGKEIPYQNITRISYSTEGHLQLALQRRHYHH